MSDEDVVKLVEVLGTADGGCSTCFRRLCQKAGRVWPDIRPRLAAAYALHPESGGELDFDADY